MKFYLFGASMPRPTSHFSIISRSITLKVILEKAIIDVLSTVSHLNILNKKLLSQLQKVPSLPVVVSSHKAVEYAYIHN